eukprot:5501314-Prymnesium_polylepis.1
MDAIHLSRCVPTRKLRGSEKPRDPANKPGGATTRSEPRRRRRTAHLTSSETRGSSPARPK